MYIIDHTYLTHKSVLSTDLPLLGIMSYVYIQVLGSPQLDWHSPCARQWNAFTMGPLVTPQSNRAPLYI
jgi:hypothetical protein